MSTYTNALRSIEGIVTDFLIETKKSTEDYVTYVQLACKCYMDFNLYDGNIVTYEKVTIDPTKKWIDMPDDMVQFVDLVTPQNGSWWSFTRKDKIVNTTTTTGGTEGRDDAQGEGHLMDQPRVTSYGAKGGWNKFKYTIDWATRRIYVDDDLSAYYIVLMYVSSGIKATGETTVPIFLAPVISAYLLWRETYFNGLVREREERKAEYWREKMKVRDLINNMSLAEWQDLFYSSFTQTPQR